MRYVQLKLYFLECVLITSIVIIRVYVLLIQFLYIDLILNKLNKILRSQLLIINYDGIKSLN